MPYLLLASMATSIFFSILVFLNSLGVTFHYYRVSTLETTFLSRQLDLYAMWFSTLVVFLALTGMTAKYGRRKLIEWLPICALAAGLVLLTSGSVTLATALVLEGQISALVVCHTIFFASSRYSFSKKRTQALIVVYLLSLALFVELSALIYWVVTGFRPDNELGRGVAVLETNLTYALSSISPWLYAALLSGWLWAPAVLLLKKRITGKHTGMVVRSDPSTVSTPCADASKVWSLALPVLLLTALGVFVGCYPYWHGPEWLVGADVYWIYKGPLDGMTRLNILPAFEQAVREHQSIFLILLFGLMRMTGLSSYEILRYTPMTLAVMTAIATFSLARTLGLDKGVSLLSGVTSIIWVPTTVGIFTSILANWFALILWVIFLAILVKKDLRVHIIGSAVLGSLFSLAILFVHPWSWGPFSAVVGLCLVFQLLARRFSRHMLTLCIAFDLSGLVAGYISLLILQTSEGLRITSALSYYAAAFLDPMAILTFPSAIEYFATIWSPFLNPVLIVVAIVGILAAVDHGDGLGRLILPWLCVTSIASVLATPLGSWGGGYLWRMFFITPIAVLTALGALHMCRTLEMKFSEGSEATLPPTHWVAGVFVSTLGMSVLSVIMPAVPALGLFLGLVLNLLLVTPFFHSGYRDSGISHVLGATIVMLIANSGLRSLAPLLVDPHNISLG